MESTRTAVALFDSYRRDWEAALEPCIVCLLERCPESERPALDALLDDHLSRCATAPYSPVQTRRLTERIQPIVDRVMNDPATIAQQDQLDATWRDLPFYVKRWRRLRFWWLWRVRLRWWALKRWREPKPWE